MQNYYFNPNHPLKPYTHSLEATEGTLPPSNAIRDKEPEIVQGKWPCWAEKAWKQVEDHREREGYPELVARYGEQYPQKATEYWLPEDTHETPARMMKEVGPLPEGALLERPEKTQTELDTERKFEILSELNHLDAKSARPMRAVLADTATDEDKDTLAEIEDKAKKLREELAGLV